MVTQQEIEQQDLAITAWLAIIFAIGFCVGALGGIVYLVRLFL